MAALVLGCGSRKHLVGLFHAAAATGSGVAAYSTGRVTSKPLSPLFSAKAPSTTA